MADRPQPTEVDFIVQSLLDDITAVTGEKAAYLGKYRMAERTNQLLAQENQSLRQKLEKYEQPEAVEPTEKEVGESHSDAQKQPPADKPRSRTPRDK